MIEHFEQALTDLFPINDRLTQAMRYACLNGGKRLRPQLVFATAKTLGLTDKSVLPFALAVELMHCYSLIHDDLPAMDDDDLRRGQPSCHKQFDEATAILAGDALQTLAIEQCCQALFTDSIKIACIQTLATACGAQGMAGGQSIDMEATGKPQTEAELKHMHQLKTGALFKACILLPAMAAQVNSDTLDNLSTFADEIGLAFQIQDDILDATANTDTLGKPAGSDAEANKSTFVSLMGLAPAKAAAQHHLSLALNALHSHPNSEPLQTLAYAMVNRSH